MIIANIFLSLPAACGLAIMVTRLSGVRNMFFYLRVYCGVTHEPGTTTPDGTAKPGSLAEMLSCRYCFSFWAGLGFMALLGIMTVLGVGDYFWIIAVPFAAVGVTWAAT